MIYCDELEMSLIFILEIWSPYITGTAMVRVTIKYLEYDINSVDNQFLIH